MKPKVDLIVCTQCGQVRERFLVGCPKCGGISNKDVDTTQKVFYEITLETIAHGKIFYMKELNDEQKTWFSDRIPNGQSWQFYAGIVLVNNLNTVWLKEIIEFEKWSEPISCGNARVYFLMSFMTKEKQQNFCNLINAFNHHKITYDKEKDKRDLQGKIMGSDDGQPTI